MSPRILALCVALVPGFAPERAQAEWRYDPGYFPAGRALGFGTAGQTLEITCGNGGYPAVSIHGPRPVPGDLADYVLRIDNGPEAVVPAECGPDGCFLMFETGAQVRTLLGGLQSGGVLFVDFFRQGTGGLIPLAGSRTAIDGVFAAGCEMP